MSSGVGLIALCRFGTTALLEQLILRTSAMATSGLRLGNPKAPLLAPLLPPRMKILQFALKISIFIVQSTMYCHAKKMLSLLPQQVFATTKEIMRFPHLRAKAKLFYYCFALSD